MQGKASFEQCSGFIRIPNGKNPLEITAVHPESYEATEKLLDKIGYKKEDIKDKEKLKEIPMPRLPLEHSIPFSSCLTGCAGKRPPSVIKLPRYSS